MPSKARETSKNKIVEIPPIGPLDMSTSTRACTWAQGLVAEVLASLPPESAKSSKVF